MRFYDSGGRYLDRVGREGEGPGEFRFITTLRVLTGDTIVVYDGRLRRATFYGGRGELIRTVRRSDSGPGVPIVIALTRGGGILAIGGPRFTIASKDGETRSNSPLYRYPPDGSPAESLGTWPGSEFLVRTEGRSVSVWQTLFGGRQTYFASGDSMIYAASNKQYSIEQLDMTGELSAIFRIDRVPIRVTEQLIEWEMARRLRDLRGDHFRRRTRNAFGDMTIPETVPMIGGMMTDAGGRLWVKQYPVDDEAEDSWDVFAPNGRWIASIGLPANFQPGHIGEEFVIGHTRDQLDIEHVLRFDLQK